MSVTECVGACLIVQSCVWAIDVMCAVFACPCLLQFNPGALGLSCALPSCIWEVWLAELVDWLAAAVPLLYHCAPTVFAITRS
jgi:hypothetical protein